MYRLPWKNFLVSCITTVCLCSDDIIRFIVYLKGEKHVSTTENENVSVSPLTRADKADIASMFVKPRALSQIGEVIW